MWIWENHTKAEKATPRLTSSISGGLKINTRSKLNQWIWDEGPVKRLYQRLTHFYSTHICLGLSVYSVCPHFRLILCKMGASLCRLCPVSGEKEKSIDLPLICIYMYPLFSLSRLQNCTPVLSTNVSSRWDIFLKPVSRGSQWLPLLYECFSVPSSIITNILSLVLPHWNHSQDETQAASYNWSLKRISETEEQISPGGWSGTIFRIFIADVIMFEWSEDHN